MSRRCWLECTLGLLSGLVLALTLVTREWVELLFRFDPDRRSGLLEWAVVAVLVATTLLCALAVRGERQRVLSHERLQRAEA